MMLSSILEILFALLLLIIVDVLGMLFITRKTQPELVLKSFTINRSDDL